MRFRITQVRIYVSGSIARDLIMDFPGRFADFIDPKKIHVLNLSFAVENLQENIGGTAANICYNLALLKERPFLIGNMGQDQIKLLNYFRKIGINTRNVEISKSRRTAAAYIITDKDDNQITGFHAGAMNESHGLPSAKRDDWAIISAENAKNMTRLAKFYRKNRINYIFDPGQQITALRNSELRIAIGSAKVLIGNDYEIGMIRKRVKKFSPITIRTFGPKGSEIFAGQKKIKIGIAKPRRVLDPTGAGDAYRAGFLKGLILGYNLKVCGQLGATVASFAVEEYGTQNHKFNWRTVINRYKINFGLLYEI